MQQKLERKTTDYKQATSAWKNTGSQLRMSLRLLPLNQGGTQFSATWLKLHTILASAINTNAWFNLNSLTRVLCGIGICFWFRE